MDTNHINNISHFQRNAIQSAYINFQFIDVDSQEKMVK